MATYIKARGWGFGTAEGQASGRSGPQHNSLAWRSLNDAAGKGTDAFQRRGDKNCASSAHMVLAMQPVYQTNLVTSDRRSPLLGTAAVARKPTPNFQHMQLNGLKLRTGRTYALEPAIHDIAIESTIDSLRHRFYAVSHRRASMTLGTVTAQSQTVTTNICCVDSVTTCSVLWIVTAKQCDRRRSLTSLSEGNEACRPQDSELSCIYL